MKYIKYTTMPIREIEPDAGYGFCDKKQRKKCEKSKLCEEQLCGRDEERLAKINIYDNKPHTLRIDRAVAKWRKETFKECRAVLFEIKVIKCKSCGKKWEMVKNIKKVRS